MRIAIFAETYFPFISGVVTHIQTLKNGLEAEGTPGPDRHHEPRSRPALCQRRHFVLPVDPPEKNLRLRRGKPINLKRLSYIRAFNPDIIHIRLNLQWACLVCFVRAS